MIENSNNSENEIENDFNNENIIDMIKENEIENFFNDEIDNNSKENKTMNSSSFSLLKELEDKWDSIERKKNSFIGNKNLENNIRVKERKKKNYILLKKEIEKLKSIFLNKIEKENEINDNKNREFEQFIYDKISEMEKYKIKSEEINKLVKEREIEKINENKKKKKPNRKKEIIKNHSFLQKEKYNNDKRNIPLKYRGNIFTCKDLTEVEGLVYETPDNINDNNNKYKNPVSESLKGKMKFVYDDIIKPIYFPDNIFNNVIMESSRENLINEENKNNNINNNKNNNNSNNVLIDNNINPKTLNSLEKNFDEILKAINPNMNQLNKGNKHMGSFLNEDYKENPEENNPELDKYFKDLSIQAKCKLPKNISKKINQTKDISINDTYYLKNNFSDKKFFKKMGENIHLLNQLVKITPNQNNIQKIRSLNNISNYSSFNINDKSPSNKSFIRNQHTSFNSDIQNIDKSNYSFLNNNRIYSKNKFEDILSKMYDINTLKIQKILQKK